jgi:hypothetical protein
MLLTRLEITNFLSIKGTMPIDLDKKVTIMLGSNDHGKSNVLRAIRHLNDGDVITEDEANWDATEEANWDPATAPSLAFTFSLTTAERREWKIIVEDLVRAAAERLIISDTSDDEEDEGATKADTPTTTSATIKPTAAAAKAGTSTPPPEEEEDPPQLPESALDPATATLTLSRKGVGGDFNSRVSTWAIFPIKSSNFSRPRSPASNSSRG